MGIFNKTDEERAQQEAAKEAKSAQRAAAEFEASPAGRARQAYADGDLFFQVEVLHAKTVGGLIGESDAGIRQTGAATGVLGSIVGEGWRRVASDMVFVPSSASTLAGSQRIAGEVIGVHLFERA